ncbi:hypothetical protein AYO44_16995 [Planctomycetaceae bacterium SCGC AG-212-F19]|nr:hypothetical protein AYO44_16995 [Planctomycetaceae bacterium SCGC AG-212-F19]
MRFALLGNHPDGLSMARALAASGRHALVAYAGPVPGFEALRQAGLHPKGTADPEEVLADPAVEAVIVAGNPGDRAVQLRRALQSERHVLCVHPADPSPDIAYEAAMLQGDTRHVLLPLLGDALHPGVARLAEMLRQPDGPLGAIRLIVVEHACSDEGVRDTNLATQPPSLPGWDVLRTLAGEVVELSAFALHEEVLPGEPLLLAGRTESGILLHASFLAGQPDSVRRFTVMGSRGRAVLTLPPRWPGPAELCWQAGETRDRQDWPAWEPWPALVEVFETALATPATTKPRPATPKPRPLGPGPAASPTWHDEVRALELDDAARRSVARRRASALEYQEVSEEVGFKGTMTLVGCGLLWGVLVLVILAAWERRFLLLVIPALLIFLGLQLFRWVIPAPPPAERRDERQTPAA